MAYQVVYKYPIPLKDEFTLLLPADATVLSAAFQNGRPVMWVRHGLNPERIHEACERTFMMVGTGQTFHDRKINMATGKISEPGDTGAIHIVDGYRFVATFMTDDQDFVLHLFEVLS